MSLHELLHRDAEEMMPGVEIPFGAGSAVLVEDVHAVDGETQPKPLRQITPARQVMAGPTGVISTIYTSFHLTCRFRPEAD